MNMPEDNGKGGRVAVSREVLADLACQAASEVEGVVGCQQPAMESITSRVKREFMQHGIRISEEKDGSLVMDLHLKVRYGASLPELADAVKRKVRDFLSAMADTQVSHVEVIIEDIDFPEA